ncbi:MAG: chitobiase/beta-hexosaminidase C-terminal domain-containing protein, partial [Oscillospiraceae bacterium]
YQGLFGYSTGLIMNVGVIDSSVTGKGCISGVCGYNDGGTVTNCFNTGTVSGEYNVGGVCGYCCSGAVVTYCYNTGAISGTVAESSSIGGVSGSGYNGCTITNCYNTGAVSGKSNVGGVCGTKEGGTFSYCYNTGSVSGSFYVGGVCGYFSGGAATSCYSAATVTGINLVGGVFGLSSGTLTSCYFSTELYSGNAVGNEQGTSTNVEGLTITELLAKFPTDAVWAAGSAGAVTSTGDRFREQTVTLPSLKNVGTAQTIELKLYNFGINGAENWSIYTEISNEAELRALANDSSKWGGSYVLTADITLTSNWTPIGSMSKPFSGKFSGDGRTISSMVINNTATDGQGLFGVSSGLIMNVGVIDSSVTGGSNVGGVCGYNINGGRIAYCYNTGSVTGSGQVGGICGQNLNGAISNCYNIGSVNGTSGVGGVCGSSSTALENCYYNSDLSADNNAGATGLNTLQMTCADALDIMGFDKTIWVKKANDKENKLAFYPSFSEEAAPSVGYTTKLDISLSDSGNPVFGEELKLDVSALVKFSFMDNFAASEEAYAGEGSFEIKCGDEYITTTAFDLPDNTVVDYTYIKGDINAGTYTFTLEYDGTGSDYLLTDTATLSVTVDKADYEEEISTIEHSHAWNISGDCTVSEIAALLPDNCGEITGVVPGATGDTEIISGKSYTDGEFKYTLADNTRDDIGKAVTITYTISTTNYNDIAVAVKVTVTDKQEQTEKPECVLTVTLADDNSYTATITPVEGAEYSFDGTTWSSTNTLTGIAHATTVKAFIRYAETDTHNAGAAASATEKTAHGTLTHHSANPATCTEDGNIEYWTCDSCDKYFSDEDGTTQITQTQTVIEKKGHTPAAAVRENEVPATCTVNGSYDEVIYCSICDAEISRTPKTITAAGHKWSEKYEFDKDGHWKICEVCKATTEKEAHIPGEPATLDHAQNCTVCGYEIAPKLGQVAAPVISPNGGTFSGSVKVTITCDTEGAAIYYTTDGTEPSANSTLYEGAFTLTATTTVKAIAIKDGMVDSEVVTATFTKKSSGGGGGGGGGYRPTTPTETLPSIDGNKMPWNEMVDYIKKAASNTFVVGLNGLTEVPENVIKAIADRDSKVTFLVDGTFSWVVDGAEITAPVKADLTVNKSDSVKSDGLRGSVGTKFSTNGTSIPAKLTISFKALHAGKFANLYKSIDGKLTFVTCAKIGADGKVILPDVTEKGDYVAMLCEFSDLPGDMNNDGVISAADASAILKQVVGLANGENPAVADMNGDGKVNAADAAEILKRIVGLA